MDQLDTLVAIALDIASAKSADERNRSLLAALRRVVPFNAAALMRLVGNDLVPVAAQGLSPAALGRRYALREHPRLDIVCKSREPVVFPPDTKLPDPFDGLLEVDQQATRHIHACLGCPLLVHGELIGTLTADALTPTAFDNLDMRLLAAAAAIAAAEMHTSQLIEALTKAAERQGLIARDLMRDAYGTQNSQLIGTSPEVIRLRQEIDLVAQSDLTVLIAGETGVGKELVARAVHSASHRSDQPLIHVNCAALPETLAESELFGYVRGAFTGANTERAGKFEVADAGTLFLDEIGELPLGVQPKLLRALQEGEIQRVGSDRTLKVDVRLVAATNRNLAEEVRSGRFRADLFHRLNVYPLIVSPLRERRADIALIAGHFCDVTRRRLGLGPVRLAADALDALERYDWPGNVRELENVISRVVLKTSAHVERGEPVILAAAHLRPELPKEGVLVSEPPPAVLPRVTDKVGMKDFAREQQRLFVQRALEACDGNLAAAARSLGMDRGNLYHLARRLGLVRKRGE